MKPSSTRPRFPGLHLSATDRRFLAAQTRAGRVVSARTWKRIRILELLHARWSLADVAAALGTYPREVRRVGWRYVEQGLHAALTDDPRPKPPKLLDTRQQAAIVAMVCGPPPAGSARWTVRVTTEDNFRRPFWSNSAWDDSKGTSYHRTVRALLCPGTNNIVGQSVVIGPVSSVSGVFRARPSPLTAGREEERADWPVHRATARRRQAESPSPMRAFQ